MTAQNTPEPWDGTPDDENCRTCQGWGFVTLVGAHDTGERAIEENCGACGGSGVRA